MRKINIKTVILQSDNNYLNTLQPKVMQKLLFVSLFLFSILVASCSGTPAQSYRSPKVAEELKHLDKSLDERGLYAAEKRVTIDSLKNIARTSPDSTLVRRVLLELSEKYRPMNADSAVIAARHALTYSTPYLSYDEKIHGRLVGIQAIATSGLFYAALTRLDSIDTTGLSPELKIEYWKTARMAYSYAASHAQGMDSYVAELQKKQREYSDSLLKNLPPTDIMHRFLYCSDLVETSDWQRAEIMLTNFLKEVPETDNFHGMFAYQLAQAYKNQGDIDGYVENLAIAARSDLQANVKEGLALQELAKWLYQQGDYERANRYISLALADAISGNVRMRTATISDIASLIEATNQKELRTSHTSMTIYAITSTVLFIITSVLAIIFLITTKKIRGNEKKLSSSTKKLEAYVGNFISLCSNYSNRLNKLTLLVARKISAGQTDDLLKMINSGKISEEDSEGFYSLLDKAFLDLFPDFVESINALLKPDRQIELKPGELLTPELRIYVFIRLGITQSTKIAQILQYSTNTVYAYRNRMRNRAIDRENFEEQVGNMGNHVNWIDFVGE